MTDFLSGLLDRSLERAPVLQRRRPSLFEPPPNASRLSAIPPGRLRQGEMEEVDSDPGSAEFRQTRVLGPTAPRPHHTALARLTTPAPESEPQKSVRLSRPAARVNPLESDKDSDARGDAIRIAPEKPILKTAARATPRITEIILEKQSDQPQPSMRLLRPQLAQSAMPMFDSSLLAPLVRPHVAPAIKADNGSELGARPDLTQRHEMELAPIKPAKETMQPVFAPLPRPVLSTRHARPDIARQTAPVVPTIQVTIGRIEVRAVPPATQATRAARPAAPKLNLEDYLRSRSGGGQ